MKKSKIRLDQILVEKGFVSDLSEAQKLILAGLVLVNTQKIDKVGTLVNPELEIRIKNRGSKVFVNTNEKSAETIRSFVSRGGFKLQKAIEFFNIKLIKKICMDVGASTGGFTDCLLQNGAEQVFAIDVGYGQLDWKLQTDSRVVIFDRTNIRKLESSTIGKQIDLITIDASFISLKSILPSIIKFLQSGAEVIALIKPQFEADRENAENGLVSSERVRLNILADIESFAQTLGLHSQGITESPIEGNKLGNVEYLIYLKYL